MALLALPLNDSFFVGFSVVANTATQMLLSMGVGSIIGPIQMGLKKPVYFTNSNASVREIIDLVTIAAIDAIALAKK